MKYRLVISLFLLGAQPALACHHFRVWRFHTPQRCSYARPASLRHPHFRSYLHPHPSVQIVPPAPPARPADPAPMDVAPTVAPRTERDTGLAALREKLLEGQPK